jgi:phosphoribosylformylglycinamidine synthase I
MAKVKTLILRAPGTNCDFETQVAFEQAGAEVDSALVTELFNRSRRLADYRIMVIPGGFTYGDDISAGRILANELRLRLQEEIRKFIGDGKLILGICNGFQVLVKAGILPGLEKDAQTLTLTNNDSGRFECRWIHLQVNKASKCVFTRGMSRLYLPIAHGEGKLVAEPALMDKLDIVLQYADETGDIKAGYPHNPNGSVRNIAGICDDSGRVFALMPHPERFIRGTQHPRWIRENPQAHGDGLQIFVNAVTWAKSI